MAYKDPKKKKEAQREYYLKNKSKCVAANYKWQKGKGSLKHRFYRGLYSARVRGIYWGIDFEQYCLVVEGKDCHYCAAALPPSGGGIDRKDSSIGYVKDNIVASCRECNSCFGATHTYEEKIILGQARLKIMELRAIKDLEAAS